MEFKKKLNEKRPRKNKFRPFFRLNERIKNLDYLDICLFSIAGNILILMMLLEINI